MRRTQSVPGSLGSLRCAVDRIIDGNRSGEEVDAGEAVLDTVGGAQGRKLLCHPFRASRAVVALVEC